MTIRQHRNTNIIRDFKQLLGTAPVMDIYYRLSDKYYLDAETIRAIIRNRNKLQLDKYRASTTSLRLLWERICSAGISQTSETTARMPFKSSDFIIILVFGLFVVPLQAQAHNRDFLIPLPLKRLKVLHLFMFSIRICKKFQFCFT